MSEGLVEHMSARSSRGRREEREVTAARRSDSAGEERAAAMSACAEERRVGSRCEGSDGNEAMEEAATSGSGKDRSERREESRSGSRRSGGRGSARRRSSARRLQTAEEGAARISVAAVRASAETSRPAAHCCRACKSADDCRRASEERRSVVICAMRRSIVPPSQLGSGDRRSWGKVAVVVQIWEGRGECQSTSRVGVLFEPMEKSAVLRPVVTGRIFSSHGIGED